MLPGMLHLPGVISFHIFGDSIQNIDLVYPSLVEDVLPKPLLGFFVACLFGAILSTFNSFVNSASTLFCYDIYCPIFNRDISEEKLIKIAKLSGLIIALISMCVAPMLQYGTEGLFLLLRKFAGFFNIPIIVLVAVGFLNKTISGIAARTVIFIHMLLYFSLVWIIKIEINFVHVMGGLFVFDILLMYILGLFFKRKIPYELSKKNQSNVSLKGWKYAHQATYLLILGLIYMYVIFSPFGLAGGKSVKNISLIFFIMAIAGFCAVSRVKMEYQIQRNTLIDKA
jgi:SSS family solute:Na+ symporter